jgi:hypothetical protein
MKHNKTISTGVIEKWCVNAAEMSRTCLTASLQLLTALSLDCVDFRPRGIYPPPFTVSHVGGWLEHGVSNA